MSCRTTRLRAHKIRTIAQSVQGEIGVISPQLQTQSLVDEEPPRKRQRVKVDYHELNGTDGAQSAGNGPILPACNKLRSRYWARQVCFGMVYLTPSMNSARYFVNAQQINSFTITVLVPNIPSQTVPVYLPKASQTLLGSDSRPIGTLSPFATDFLHTLSADEAIELHIQCHPVPTHYTSKRRRKNETSTSPATIVVYGEFELFDDIGTFCEESGIFLQDPIGCDRVVEYRNPHRLSGLDGEATMTSMGPPLLIPSDQMHPVNFLSGFENGVLLPEIADPSALQTKLHKHQRQALAFMLAREQGWQLDDPRRDIWSRELSNTGCWLVS
jgi:hypothetical protein